jgi:hypothetical protein
MLLSVCVCGARGAMCLEVTVHLMFCATQQCRLLVEVLMGM